MGNNRDEMEEIDNVIILNDENGNPVSFEFLDLIEYDGAEYVVLLPMEEDADEVVILQIEEVADDPDLESYVSVEDEDTLSAVFEIFKQKFRDACNFVD